MSQTLAEWMEIYKARKAAEAETQRTYLELTGQSVAHPNVIPAADEAEVLREQLELAIESGPTDGRYISVRAILLGLFADKTQERPFAMSMGGYNH